MHVTLREDDETYVHAKPDKEAKYAGEVTKAFGQDDVLSYKDLVKSLEEVAGIANSTAKARIKDYAMLNLVEKLVDGTYRIPRRLVLHDAGLLTAFTPVAEELQKTAAFV